jgi:hypothetical protein
MLKRSHQITLSWSEAIEVLRELNLLVVSLDKIGSYYACTNDADFDNDAFEKEVTRFIVDWKVLKRLAKIRGVISEKFDRKLGEDDMDDVERTLEDLKCWSSPGDMPKNDWSSITK